jgi:hypothetical protein
MKLMIIPIGVDCGIATLLRKYNLRNVALPFDWLVSYNGVASCFEDSFHDFIPSTEDRINAYDMYFMHDFLSNRSEDEIKYRRRIERLCQILESSEPIIFVRKGHATHQHGAHEGRFDTITNDLMDVNRLDSLLTTKYRKLNYKIILLLVCGKCFDASNEYTSPSKNIEIHNLAMDDIDDAKIEAHFCKIFKLTPF